MKRLTDEEFLTVYKNVKKFPLLNIEFFRLLKKEMKRRGLYKS